MWNLEFFESNNGEIPVEDFLNGLDIKMRAKVIKELQLLKFYGTELREPYSKFVQDGIFELRTKLSSNITRVFYFFCVDKKIILTNGFVKKTEKTPKNELNRALQYKAEYEQSKK